jgi:hypothetical protein
VAVGRRTPMMSAPERVDLDPATAGELRHPRVRLDPEHRAAGRLELPGFDAGAAADIQDIACAARKTGSRC